MVAMFCPAYQVRTLEQTRLVVFEIHEIHFGAFVAVHVAPGSTARGRCSLDVSSDARWSPVRCLPWDESFIYGSDMVHELFSVQCFHTSLCKHGLWRLFRSFCPAYRARPLEPGPGILHGVLSWVATFVQCTRFRRHEPGPGIFRGVRHKGHNGQTDSFSFTALCGTHLSSVAAHGWRRAPNSPELRLRLTLNKQSFCCDLRYVTLETTAGRALTGVGLAFSIGPFGLRVFMEPLFSHRSGAGLLDRPGVVAKKKETPKNNRPGGSCRLSLALSICPVPVVHDRPFVLSHSERRF